MSQPDQSDMQSTADESVFNVRREMGAQAEAQKKSKGLQHEWVPEDDDDWYEPEYWRPDYKNN